jgi:hypothetical protein
MGSSNVVGINQELVGKASATRPTVSSSASLRAELDAVAGGRTIGETKLFTAFYDGLVSTCGQAGRNMLQDSANKYSK